MTAIFPGSFDPVTYGHIDLMRRGAGIFDRIIAAVLNNPSKKPLLTVAERVSLLGEVTKDIPGIQIEATNGLLAEFAKERDVRYILRGVRVGDDCQYEISRAQANRKLHLNLETVILVTDPAYSYMSAGLIREIAAAGYNCSNFDDKVLDQWVPPTVKDMIKNKYVK